MSCRIQSHEEITNQTTSLCLKRVRGLALGPAFTHYQSMIRVILRDLYNYNMDITQLLMSVGSTEPTLNPKLEILSLSKKGRGFVLLGSEVLVTVQGA